jgi:hypothetical protein
MLKPMQQSPNHFDTARLILDPPQVRADGRLRLGARLVETDGDEQSLWWALPATFADAVTPFADPWLVGLLFPIMQRDRPVHIEGCVSRSLLQNLEHLMAVWHAWTQGRYHTIQLTADHEAELPPVPEPGKTLVSFSCGVDSCFTTYRHMRGLAGRRSRTISAGVVQHGFDIWPDQAGAQEVYDGVLRDASTMLSSLDLACIPLATNFHDLRVPWGEAWGTQLVSGLSLLSARYDTALIANDMPYTMLDVPWAHHPLTTPMLGSAGFTVLDDGGEATRPEKIRTIANWQEATERLRVCFGVNVPGKHDNCCRCEKCIRTILAFRATGYPLPGAFRHDVTDDQIRRVRLNPVTALRWRHLAAAAADAGLDTTSWARAIQTALRRHDWRENRNRLQRPFIPVRNLARRLLRGSPLSRSEIAARAKS